MTDGVLAYDVDTALAIRLAFADRRRAQAGQPGQPWGAIPAGQAYEDPQAALRAELESRRAA